MAEFIIPLITLIALKPISEFISKRPSFKMLALSMTGIALTGEGLHVEIPKGYIYFSGHSRLS